MIANENILSIVTLKTRAQTHVPADSAKILPDERLLLRLSGPGVLHLTQLPAKFNGIQLSVIDARIPEIIREPGIHFLRFRHFQVSFPVLTWGKL